MAVPVNPGKCRYTAMGLALQKEVMKGGFLSE